MAVTQFVEGIDVSHHQKKMDWTKASMAGAEFAYIRAGSCYSIGGANYTDREFHTNAQEASKLMPVGFYWYSRPNYSAISQADYFASLINAYDFALPPALDSETTGGKNPDEVANFNKVFLDRVFAKTTVKPLIYSRSEFYNRAVAQRDYWSSYDYWVARYTDEPQPWGNDGDKPFVQPRDWNTWTFWQHSARGNGRGEEYGAKSLSIDLTRFNGDRHAFAAYMARQIPVPPPVEPELVVPKYLVNVTANALNMRELPDVNSRDFGELIKNSVVPVVEEHGDWLFIKGYIHKGYVKKV